MLRMRPSPLYDNSKVTLELRELIESGVNLWDFDYPSYYDGDAKRAFEQKVIDHYYFRQIGQETPARFIHYFRSRIREIMPYYIQRYKSVEVMENIEDPFESYNLTETYTETRTGTGKIDGSTTDTSESSSSSSRDSSRSENVTENVERDNTKKFSNTPQGSIANLDNYLTEATVDGGSENKTNNVTASDDESASSTANVSSSGTSSQTSEDESTVTHELKRKGNIGVATLAQEMNSFRTSFLNVDMEIINELSDLFLLIY